MANRLKMAKVNSILTLHQQGWSQRRIAEQLGVHRETVSRYIAQWKAGQAEAPTGSEPSKPATAPTGSGSACEPFREIILEKLAAGLSAQRIYQDLRADHEFSARYPSVRRFVRQLRTTTPIPFRRMESLPGHRFTSLDQQNRHLLHWETAVADTRIHGTTRKQVGKLFEEIEKPALGALPVDRFPFFEEGQRSVHRDGHVEVAKAYYSVPCEYVTRRVWVRWDSRLVRIFNHRWDQIAVHPKREPGSFSTNSEHIHREKVSSIERGTEHLLRQAAQIGEQTAAWSEAMLACRGVPGIRVLLGLTSLAREHPYEEIEEACAVALGYQAYHLKTIRELIKRQAPKQQCFEFLEEHPMIRPLGEYDRLFQEAFEERSMQ